MRYGGSMRTLKRIVILVCFSSFLSSNLALAQGTPSDEKSTRIGLIFLGSVTTSLARKKSDTWFFIGWAVLLLGTVSSVSRLAKDVIRDLVLLDDTQIDIYAGGDGPENLQGTVEAKHYLEKIEMDSYVAAHETSLAQNLPMVEVINHYHMDPQRVGQIIMEAKALSDSLLNGNEFGKQIFFLNYRDLKANFVEKDLSLRETHLVKNYLRLRNISLRQ